MMKIKRWMMAALLGVMTVFAAAANPMELDGESIQNNNTVKSIKEGLLNASKAVLQQARTFISLVPGQDVINSAEREMLWVTEQNKAENAMEPVPGNLIMMPELPQSIQKISGILIHADPESIDKILRTKEYRGSG